MAWNDGTTKETRVLIVPTSSSKILEGEGQNYQGHILSLRHPKSRTPTCFILRNESLQELHWFKQAYGSWFLGDYVSEDGSLYISTPFDPVFLLLPVFEEARMKKSNGLGMFREINEILFVDGYPGYQKLLSLAENSMSLVCEVKEIGSSKFYRLDDSKVLNWLHCKINKLKTTILTLDKNYAAREEADTLNDAVSLLSEYINESWLKTLCDHINVDLDLVMRKTPKTEIPMQPAEEGNLPSLDRKQRNSKGASEKTSKKTTPVVESKNIRSMFMRAAKNKNEPGSPMICQSSCRSIAVEASCFTGAKPAIFGTSCYAGARSAIAEISCPSIARSAIVSASCFVSSASIVDHHLAAGSGVGSPFRTRRLWPRTPFQGLKAAAVRTLLLGAAVTGAPSFAGRGGGCCFFSC